MEQNTKMERAYSSVISSTVMTTPSHIAVVGSDVVNTVGFRVGDLVGPLEGAPVGG